jgi:pyruvate/2-oxoglutarate dehydrogenase complex dihydrolipoamide acyltransferase (E2) component
VDAAPLSGREWQQRRPSSDKQETIMPTQILMPALSPTMEEGKLAKWLVKEGQKVRSGDIIAEIETDKATMEVEAVDEGTVGSILIAEGTDKVKVNTPIAVLLGEGESAGAAPAPKPAAAPAPAPAPAAAAAPKPQPAPAASAPAAARGPEQAGIAAAHKPVVDGVHGQDFTVALGHGSQL